MSNSSKTRVTIEAHTDPSTITLVKKAIHNPKEPRHYMTVNSVEGHFSATHNGVSVASTNKALEMLEVAHILVRPVYYFHKSNVHSKHLVPSTKETQCPLKGLARYYHISVAEVCIENAVWSYHQTIPGAQIIKDYYAFDPSLIKVDIKLSSTL